MKQRIQELTDKKPEDQKLVLEGVRTILIITPLVTTIIIMDLNNVFITKRELETGKLDRIREYFL